MVTTENRVLSTIVLVQQDSSMLFSFAINAMILPTGIDNCNAKTPKTTGLIVKSFNAGMAINGMTIILKAINLYVTRSQNIAFKLDFAIEMPMMNIERGMVAFPI